MRTSRCWAPAACACAPPPNATSATASGRRGACATPGPALALGSDSQAVIDLFEEARAVELDERLASGARGLHRPAELLGAATAAGTPRSAGPTAGRLEAGALADLVTVSLDGVRLAGTPAEHALDAAVFAAAAADVRHVMTGGRWIVRDGAHLALDVPAELRRVLAP